MKINPAIPAANVIAINDNSRYFPAANDNARSGIIMAANDANFDAVHMSEPLTEMTIDYPDADGLDTSEPPRQEGCTHTATASKNPQSRKVSQIGDDFSQLRRLGTFPSVPRSVPFVNHSPDRCGERSLPFFRQAL